MESHKEGIPLFEKHPLNLGIAHLVGVGGGGRSSTLVGMDWIWGILIKAMRPEKNCLKVAV